ncbi:MAG TPA: hypothetical protein VJ345_06050, partial [Anaerolineales bacterium]|nr:hypothetical protein [Anaerolineales bacterium]
GREAACYNWPAMEFRRTTGPRPHDWRRHRRLEWLMIYLPLILGLFGLVGLGMLLGRAQVASASTWADAGLVLLLVVALGPALILLVLVLGLAAGLWYLVRWLPSSVTCRSNPSNSSPSRTPSPAPILGGCSPSSERRISR